VTAFLEACQNGDYQRASQYLDLRQIPARTRATRGPALARAFETILNADSHFNVLRLDRRPEGDLTDDPDPDREHVATVSEEGRNLVLDLERVTLQPGQPPVWLFSHDAVAAIPKLVPQAAPLAFERYLPSFLVSRQIVGTPLWKWLALAMLMIGLISLSRSLDRALAAALRLPAWVFRPERTGWLSAIVQPLRLVLWLVVLRIAVEILDPSAIARLYLGRAMGITFAGALAWCLIRLVTLFMDHLEARLDQRQQLASRAMLRLGRRGVTLTIVVLTILALLQNLGYNTSALLTGLGVGGIAVALAAQQTISNIFGGVSIVGDHPIRIGDFGKFGDMVGIVEDIGMRSTRIRTLNRTVVSVPNANLANLNLENYSIRDKILFNPTFQIKRSATPEQMRELMHEVETTLGSWSGLETVSTPARVVALASGAFSLEIFCYVLTSDIDQFYRVQGDLLFRINDIFKASNVELV
jgi:MscS family membrane protein